MKLIDPTTISEWFPFTSNAEKIMSMKEQVSDHLNT